MPPASRSSCQAECRLGCRALAKKKKRKITEERALYESRKYGFFWYSALWHVIRFILVGLCAITLVCGMVYTGIQKFNEAFFAPMDPTDTTAVTFAVKSGNSLSSVSRDLEASGLIHNSTVFKYMADFNGMGQRIQSGTYTFSRAMSAEEILGQLVSGDGRPNTLTITIIPGWTIEDIGDYLVKSEAIASKDEFLALCKDTEKYRAYDFIEDIVTGNRKDGRLYLLEGYLSPNTYEIYTSSDTDTIIRKLLTQTGAVFLNSYAERAETLGLSMDEVFTLASMIETEAKAADFAKVSAVFHNRLKQNMTLGSDATVKYVSGSEKMSLNEGDLAVNSPYNTYLYRGLPPGPICNPSMDAVIAALYPDEQFVALNYLYFCSTDPNSGELHFSRTLEEHNAAVAMYRPLWEEFDRSRGL